MPAAVPRLRGANRHCTRRGVGARRMRGDRTRARRGALA
ncbi:hypothetical protein BUH_3669 [Burkholderia pseudomallei Pakistan 9]|nr:hypothetical protein BUH_3669 [Burkholderia pseudomallei Pakistan 9]